MTSNSTASAHTAGPWTCVTAKTLIHVETRNGIVDGEAICSLPKKHIANARLIAAAPELLEALKEIMATEYEFDPESRTVHPNEMDKYESLILKAEGK